MPLPLRRIVRRILIAFVLPSLAPAVLAAQGAPVPPASPVRWTVTSDELADLWFHTLAATGYDGYGPLLLYDRAEAARVRAARAAKGVASPLADRARELRAGLEADSAFEVLHFVPLYFVGQPPLAVLHALRAAAGDESVAPGGGIVAARAALVAGALPTARERTMLRTLAELAEQEWRAFQWTYRAEHSLDDRARTAMQAAWDQRFAPALAAVASGAGITRAAIVVSPAVGADGRLLAESGGAIVIVGRGDASAPDAPLLAAVKELSYLLLDSSAAGGDRIAAARARDAAAVRAGAMLLDAESPALAAAYRAQYRAAAARGTASFEQLYPIDPATERSVRLALQRARDRRAARR